MAINRKAAFSRLNIARRFDEQDDRLGKVETGRTLVSASIGSGGLSVKGGSIVIYDAGGAEIMRLSTAGLTMEGLLRVIGEINVEGGGDITVADGGDITVSDGGDITVSGGGAFEALDGSRIRARYADGGTAVLWGSLVLQGTETPDGHGLLIQDNLAGAQEDIFRAYRNPSGDKLVLVGQTSGGGATIQPVDAMRCWANDLELYSLGENDPEVLFLYSANRVFIEAEGNVQLQTSTAGGDIFLNSADQISLLSGASQVFIEHATVGSDDNCVISSTGLIRRVASARKYKQDIRDLHVDPHAVLDLRPRTWRDRGEAATDPDTDRWHVGFIAEEVEDAGLGAFVNYDQDGEPSSLQYDRLTVALLETLKAQQAQIEALMTWAAAQGFMPPDVSAETTDLPKRRPAAEPQAHQPRGRPDRRRATG